MKKFDQSFSDNQELHKKIGHKVMEEIEPHTKKIDEQLKLFPIYKVLIQMEKFVELGRAIEPNLGKFDDEILSLIFDEQIDLLKGQERIMTIHTYLKILSFFNKKYSTLYCVNKTLPIFWLSPPPNENEFIENYAQEKPTVKVHRFTRVGSKEDLRNQYETALKAFKENATDEFIDWGLVLFNRLYSCEFDEIIDVLTHSLSESYRKDLKDIIRKKGEASTRTAIKNELVANSSSQDKDNLKKNLIEIGGNEKFTELINKKIIELFVTEHGEDGSYYVKDSYLKTSYKEMFSQNEGEYGVYLDEKENVVRAFATLGDFGGLIRLKIWQDEKQIYNTIKELFEGVKRSDDREARGNMGCLYEQVSEKV